MQAIPRDLYEAAAIDGAGAWRQFWRITVPMLRPTIIFTVIISTIGGLQLFTEPLLFNTGSTITGGSLRQSQTVAMYIVRERVQRTSTFGYARGRRLGAVPDHPAWSALVNFLLVRRLAGADHSDGIRRPAVAPGAAAAAARPIGRPAR